MDQRSNFHPRHCYNRSILLNHLLVFLFLTCFVSPLALQAEDKRGIAITSTSEIRDITWGNYHALIIGINAYQEWNPLRTAVKDAQALKDILVDRYGFDKQNVILRTDRSATRLRLIADLRNLASNLGPADNLLIYFAGHGQIDDLTGDGYWIPSEGKLKDPGTWISHLTIKSILSSEKVKGKNVVVVADSCYSGMLLRGGPSLLPLSDTGYLVKLSQAASRRSRQVITSGGVEPVTDGGRDGHSLFAYYLLKALTENDRQAVDLENLFHTRVWKPVSEIGGQRPNVGRLKTPMDDDGQFVLIDRKRLAAKGVLQDQQAPDQFEALWAERQRLEIERKRLEFEKQILEEKQKLEAERQEIEQAKQNLASIQKSQAGLQAAGIDQQIFKLAIFPVNGKSRQQNPWTNTIHQNAIRNLLDTSFDLIGDYKDIRLKYSYYPKERYKKEYLFDHSVEFIDTVIDSSVKKKLWRKNSLSSELEPNLELVVEYGRKIGADLVLMHKYTLKAGSEGDRSASAYVIDINKSQIYAGSISSVRAGRTKKMIKTVLDMYLSKHQ